MSAPAPLTHRRRFFARGMIVPGSAIIGVLIAAFLWHGFAGPSRQMGAPQHVASVLPSASQKSAEIDRLLQLHATAFQQMEGLGNVLGKTSGPLASVAGLGPAIEQINAFRSRTLTIGVGKLAREVNVWSAICKVSPAASALDMTLTELTAVVERSKVLLEFCREYESTRSRFHQALDQSQRNPTAENVAALGKSASHFKICVSSTDSHLAILEAKLASVYKALATSRRVLLSIVNSSIRPSAQTLGGLLNRPVAVTESASGSVIQYRVGLTEGMGALASVADKASDPQKEPSLAR